MVTPPTTLQFEPNFLDQLIIKNLAG